MTSGTILAAANTALYAFAYYISRDAVAKTVADHPAAVKRVDEVIPAECVTYTMLAGTLLLGYVQDIFGIKSSFQLTHLGSAAIYFATLVGLAAAEKSEVAYFALLVAKLGTTLQHTMMVGGAYGASVVGGRGNKAAAGIRALGVIGAGYGVGTVLAGNAKTLVIADQAKGANTICAAIALVATTLASILAGAIPNEFPVAVAANGKVQQKVSRRGTWLSLVAVPLLWIFVVAARFGRFWFQSAASEYDPAKLLPANWPVKVDYTIALPANLVVVPILLGILGGNARLYNVFLLFSAAALRLLPVFAPAVATQNGPIVGAAMMALGAMLYQAPNVLVAEAVPEGAKGRAVAVAAVISSSTYVFGAKALDAARVLAAPALKAAFPTAGAQGAIIAAAALVLAALLIPIAARKVKTD